MVQITGSATQFLRVVTGAFVHVVYYRKVLFKALLIPFIGYLAIDAAGYYLELDFGGGLLLGAVTVAIHTIFAVTTHRVILLGPDSISPWGLARWTRRETFFAIYLFAIGFAMIPAAIFSFIPVVGWTIAILLMCWLMGRLSLVFPGIAVDKGVGFGRSWDLTANYQVLMLAIVVALPVLLSIPALLTTHVPHASFFTSFISTLAVVFEIAVLSVAYKLITDHNDNQNPPTREDIEEIGNG